MSDEQRPRRTGAQPRRVTELYRAKNETTGELILVHVLREISHDEFAQSERLQGTAEALRGLDHPNLPRIFQCSVLTNYENRSHLCLMMEEVYGESLWDRMRRGPRFTQAEAQAWLSRISDACQAAHAVGLFHGALSAKCIKITREGHPKVMGFGAMQLQEYDRADAREPSMSTDADLCALAALDRELQRRALPGASPMANQVRARAPELPLPPPFVPARIDVAPISNAELLRALGDPAAPYLRLAREPLRPAQALAAVERFCLRNGIVEIGPLSLGTATYLVARFGFAVEADEHSEAEATVVVGDDGGEPHDAFDAIGKLDSPEPLRGPTPSVDIADLAERARGAVRRAAEPIVSGISRRHARAHAELIASAAARAPETAEADLVLLAATRDAELEALRGRFTARVVCTRVSCSWVVLPAAAVSVTLRRRKSTRTITLRVPAGARLADKVCCEACRHVAISKPAACDDRMHLLCEGCAPTAEGRIACPLCR